MEQTKYIFITGGVTSSLGKGIIAASLAKLLQSRGYAVTIQKLDPYINIDSGTLNPYEHGECYVTEDGAETDLDLGHYERYLNINLSQVNHITTGKIYQRVIEKERRGDFLGKTVQVIPHITDEIKSAIQQIGNSGAYRIVVTEIGGTVGDIELLPYIEAIRQLMWEMRPKNAILIHLTLIPYLSITKELKTKPTQHSVKTLMGSGVFPDILICRTPYELSNELKNKLALYCNVEQNAVIQNIDVETIYEVPNLMFQEGLDKIVLEKLGIANSYPCDLTRWNQFLKRYRHYKYQVTIGLVGKYIELPDAYKSILEALIHAGVENDTKVNITYFHAEHIKRENLQEFLTSVHGILVAPGFGQRGNQGKIDVIKQARLRHIPFLGICLGMQVAIIEFIRNVLGYKKAHSTEVDPNTKYPVITLMEEQKAITYKGGTMRLGGWECALHNNSLIQSIYNKKLIIERHRHRYEFNNIYKTSMEEAGLRATGLNPQTQLVEVIELSCHPWFIGVQYHPEYKSTFENPHPLLVSFVKAALQYHLSIDKKCAS